MFRHVQYLFIISLLTAFPLHSEEMPEEIVLAADSAKVEDAPKEHKGIVSRVIEYFNQSNKPSNSNQSNSTKQFHHPIPPSNFNQTIPINSIQ